MFLSVGLTWIANLSFEMKEYGKMEQNEIKIVTKIIHIMCLGGQRKEMHALKVNFGIDLFCILNLVVT